MPPIWQTRSGLVWFSEHNFAGSASRRCGCLSVAATPQGRCPGLFVRVRRVPVPHSKEDPGEEDDAGAQQAVADGGIVSGRLRHQNGKP